MHAINIFQRIVYLLAPMAIALPHDQMVNTEFIRDVGLLFSQGNFTGSRIFLVTHKKERKCETVDSSIL
jgi:hypothetical protein